MQAKEVRYISALPTRDEVAENPALLFSDHLPFLFNAHDLTVVSWNVLDPNLPSGYEPYKETSDQVNQRRLRILESLERICEANHGVDLILLQESSWLGEDLFIEVKECVWHEVGMVAGNKILFNKQFNIKNMSLVETKNSAVFGGMPCALFELKNGSAVKILNVQGESSELPFRHKVDIEAMLGWGQKVIVAGDFNIRIAPQDHRGRESIVTGLVPQRFREFGSADCNWTDGGFSGGINILPKQCNITLLDPQTGEKADLSIPILLSDFQKNEASLMHPCIKIGVSPFANFEAQLRARLSQKEHGHNLNINVLCSSNAFNEKGMMITFSNNEKLVFERVCNDIKGIGTTHVMKPDGGRLNILLMTGAQFVEVQEWFCRNAPVKNQNGIFSASIEQLIAPQNFPFSFCSRLIQLQRLLSYLNDDGASVDECKKIKEELKDFEQSPHPLTALFSKIILANYYLRFSEYDEQQFKKMKENETEMPRYVIRPMHLIFAIEYCAKLIEAMTPQFLDSLSVNESKVLVKNVTCLYGNISTFMSIARDNLATMLRLYYKAARESENTTEQVSSLHYNQASEIIKAYEYLNKAHDVSLKNIPVDQSTDGFFITKLDVNLFHESDRSCIIS